MGAPRGQRNRAREKRWPGAQAEKIIELKRDASRFVCDGVTNWKLVESEANKLLPEFATIEIGTVIQSSIVVNLTGKRQISRSFNETAKTYSKKLEKAESKKLEIGSKLDVLDFLATFKAPAPLSSTPIDRSPIKHPVGTCDRCGGPRGSAFAGIFGEKHYCKVCYRLNAAERREAKIVEKKAAVEDRKKLIEFKRAALIDERSICYTQHFEASAARDKALEELNLAIDGFNYWVEDFALCIPKEMPGFDGGNWESPVAQQKMKEGTSHTLIRSCPDFADQLIELIEEAEQAVGLPIAKWVSEHACLDMFATKENRKPLYFSSKEPRVELAKNDVRRERPKWKMIRGEWA